VVTFTPRPLYPQGKEEGEQDRNTNKNDVNTQIKGGESKKGRKEAKKKTRSDSGM
jgi:hypothetical protein